MIDNKTTTELEHIFANASSEHMAREIVGALPDDSRYDSFAGYYHSLENVQQLGIPEIISRSGMDWTYCYQILNGNRQHPSRDKVLRLCIAAQLTVDETQRALKVARVSALYPRIRRDAILTFAIGRKLSCIDTDALLDSFGEEPLK